MSMPTVAIVGGSARAAAGSALRAGWSPWCIDLFADSDLRAMAPVTRIPFADYPQRIPQLLKDAPPGPVIYTGGLENHPRIIEQIAAEREVWGNSAATVRQVRDPFVVATLFQANRIECPQLSKVREAGDYLKKPLRGAGGLNIAIATPDEPSPAGYYFQQFIPGPAYAAVYFANEDRCYLLGVTEQIVGEPALNAKPFHYAGSIGPVPLSFRAESTLKRIGEVLYANVGMRGVFGVDFILNDNQVWPVEVNPRYTASIEVVERATGIAAFTLDRFAFPTQPLLWGKAILFASRRVVVRQDFLKFLDAADVPAPGEIIEANWPILTLFTSGANSAECRQALFNRAREIFTLVEADSPA